MKCPCKGCERRTLTCHGLCENYQEWKKENTARNDWLKEQNRVHVSDSVIKKHWKNLSYSRRRVTKVSKEDK